jgi:hypothetical protein
MLGLALGAAKMIGGAAKAKAGRGARFARNMMGRGKGDGGGGSSAIVARPSSSIIPKPDESSAIVKAPKVKRTYVRLGMEGHLINIRDNVTAIDDYLKGTIAAQKKEIEEKKKQGSEQRRAKQEQKLEKPKKNQKFNMKGMKMPKTGILDGIFNFIANVLMGMLVLKLMEFGEAIEKSGVLQFIGKAADFVLKFGGKLLDGLMTLIDKAYQLYDGLGDKVAEVFGEDGRKAFDDFSSTLNKVLNATISVALVAAALSGGMSKIPVDKQAIKQLKNVPGKSRLAKNKTLRRYISRFGRKAAERRFGKAAVQQLGGRFARSGATNLARQAMVKGLGKKGTKQLLKSMKTFVSPIVKRIPLVGALIDFALNYFVFKEPIGRAAFMAIGAGLGTWVGGLLGTAIPIPLVGTAIGAFLGAAGGDILGGAIYDMIFGGQSEDAAKQVVAAQGEATDKEEYTGGRNMFQRALDPLQVFSKDQPAQPKTPAASVPTVSTEQQGKGSEAAQKLKKDFPQIGVTQDRQIYASGLGFYLKKVGAGRPGRGDYGDPPGGDMEHPDHGGVVASHRGSGHYKGLALDLGANSATSGSYTDDQRNLWPFINNYLKKYGLNKEPFVPQVIHGPRESFSPRKSDVMGPDRSHHDHFHVEFEGGGYVDGKYDMNRIKTYASYEAGNSDPIVIPLPLPQQTPAPQTYGDNQQITSVISGGERSNPFEFLDFQG